MFELLLQCAAHVPLDELNTISIEQQNLNRSRQDLDSDKQYSWVIKLKVNFNHLLCNHSAALSAKAGKQGTGI